MKPNIINQFTVLNSKIRISGIILILSFLNYFSFSQTFDNNKKSDAYYNLHDPQTLTRYLQPSSTFKNDPYSNVFDQDLYVNSIREWIDTLTIDTLGNSFILNLIGGSQGIYGSTLNAEILVKTSLGEISVASKDFPASCFYTLPFYNIYPRKMNVEIAGIVPAIRPGDLLLLRIKVKSGAAGRIMYGTTTGTNYLKILGPLLPPTLSFPSNDTLNTSVDPLLAWTSSDAATSYYLQVSTQSDFSAIAFSDTNIVATSIKVNNLDYSTKYYWRVKAKNITGSSVWSEVCNFTTATALSIPTLSSPADGSINQQVNLSLQWNTVQAAQTYALQISGSSDFLTLVVNQTGLTSTSFSPIGLNGGTKFYWRVAAISQSDTSAWSSVWNFTTITIIPVVPNLNTPVNNSSIPPGSVTLTWNPSSGAATYNVQVSPASDFSVSVLNQTGMTVTSLLLSGLPGGMKFYWRVSATNANGTSAWSETWNFSVVSPIPPTPVLAAPANNSLNQPLNQTLTWNTASGAVSYTVQISTSSNFNTLVLNQAGLTSTSFSPTGLAYQTKYYWRVNATNASGTSGWSETWNFTTTSGASTPLIQASDIIVSDITGTSSKIKWTKGSGSRSIVFVKQGTDGFPEPVDNFSYSANANFGTGSQIGGSGWFCVYLGTDSTVTIYKLNGQTAYKTMVISLNGNEGEEKYLRQTTKDNPITFTTLCDPDFYGILPDVHLYVINPSTFDVEITNTHSCGTTTLKFMNIALSNRSFNITVNAYPNTGNMQGTMSADGNSFSGTYNITYKYLHPMYGYPVTCSTKSGSWSATRKSPGPVIPLLNYPENNAVNLPVPQVLKWYSASGALSYSVQVSKSDGFNPVLFSGNNITATEYSLPVLESNSKYYWRVSASNDCYTTSWSDPWNFTTATGVSVSNIFEKEIIRVYPNPANDRLYIEVKNPQSQVCRVSLFTLSGQKLLDQNFEGTLTELDIRSVNPGMYLIRAEIGDDVHLKKTIIE